MDYEKKYKEALEKATELNNRENASILLMGKGLEYIFPELKESEDERIRKQLIAVVELYYGETPEQEKKDCLAWLEKQSEEARNIALRTEYEKGRADAIAEMQKSVSITDKWIEDYWQHKKVNNPYSYDKGEEIQFDHQGFVRFCKKYCKKPAWSEEDKSILDSIISDIQLRIEAVENEPTTEMYAGLLYRQFNWLKSIKDRYTWKPSDEQMRYLSSAIEESGGSSVLQELYDQLKKLKED